MNLGNDDSDDQSDDSDESDFESINNLKNNGSLLDQNQQTGNGSDPSQNQLKIKHRWTKEEVRGHVDDKSINLINK